MMKIPKVLFAQTAWKKNIKQAIENANQVKPFVSQCIIVTDVTENLPQDDPKVKFVYAEWVDDIPTYCNHVIDAAKQLDMDWILFSDPDEHFNDGFLSSIPAILLTNQQYNGFNIYGHLNIKDYEKLDAGTLAREAPGGLGVNTNAWKLLLYRVENITKYEKTGHSEKCIHHTILGDWNILKLPSKYYYTHDKTVEEIWASSVRNLFICGGGDNEGDNNPYYVKLHEACDNINVKTWRQFVEYCERGNIDISIKRLIIAHRDDNDKYYSSEIRDMFHWYFDYLHPEENIGVWKSKFFIPANNQTMIEELVQKAYFQVLGRHTDGPGRLHYVEAVLTGKLDEISLIKALKESEEYIKNYINTTLFEVMGRGATIVEMNFYYPCVKNGVIADFRQFLINVGLMAQAKLAYCQMCHKGDLEDAIINVQKSKDFVDACIVVYDKSLSVDDINRLKEAGARPRFYKWHDNFPEMRNNYLTEARLYGANWVMVSDPDEHFDTKILTDVKQLINQANMVGVSMLMIASHDVYSDDEDGKPYPEVHEHIPDNYWKNLIYRLDPNVGYKGVGETQNLHEDMIGMFVPINLPKEYFYRHLKSHAEIWEHSARNIVISGGGMNAGMTVPAYRELKPILIRLKLETWYETRDYLKAGKIDEELKNFIINHRNDTGNGSWDSEYRELFKYYFYKLHPEENIENLKVTVGDSPAPPKIYDDEIKQFINDTYKQILKRDADTSGLEHYKSEISNGRLKKEDLSNILMSSLEYKAIAGHT
jgi:Domain of unknown function (DUF4214)